MRKIAPNKPIRPGGTKQLCKVHCVYLRAPLKTTLLGFERIFFLNNSLWKVRNTQSIPDFPKLLLSKNLSPKSSKSSF